MAEPKNSELEGGIYKKVDEPIEVDIKNTPVGDLHKLNELSRKTGVDYPYSGDKDTVTPERMVIVPKKRKK